MRHLITPPDVGGIQAVQVGDRVAVLHIERGVAVVSAGARAITEVDGDVVRIKRDKFLKSNGGACSYAMHAQDVAHYYYSVNPVHVAEADRKAWEARVERDRVERDTTSRRAIASGLGALLGDGERYTETYGEAYGSTEASDVLAERLSVEQLETLKSWLS